LILFSAIARVWEDRLRNQHTPLDDKNDFTTAEGLRKATGRFASYMLGSPFDQMTQGIPIIKDATFALQHQEYKDYKEVQFPIVKQISDFTTAIGGLQDLIEYQTYKQLSPKQKKALLYSMGYLTGGLPVNAGYKLANFFDTNQTAKDIAKSTKGSLKDLSDKITVLLSTAESQKLDLPKDYMEELKKLQNEIDPKKESAAVPPKAIETIKQIASEGNPNKYNSATGAAGSYQFTEKVWNGIREQAPELGLTENGRVSTDQAQQEKAMNWVTNKNAQILKAADLPVSTENLYAAHILGYSQAISVLRAPGDTKLKALVSDEFLKNYDLKSSMKVKDFKEWLNFQSVQGELKSEDKQAGNGV
jgi:hypothetical protein